MRALRNTYRALAIAGMAALLALGGCVSLDEIADRLGYVPADDYIETPGELAEYLVNYLEDVLDGN